MLSPGAARSTFLEPKSEKLASPSGPSTRRPPAGSHWYSWRDRTWSCRCSGVVAGCDNDQHALVLGRLDLVLERLRGIGAAERAVDDLGALLDRVLDPLDCVRHRAVALGVHELERHHAARPAHARNALPVVRAAGDDAGDMGAVPVVVLAVALAGDEVDAVVVVDVAVLVVVLAVVGLLLAVVPEVVLEVRMVGVDPRVEDPDLRAVRFRVPGVGRLGVDGSCGLGVLAREQRVVGRCEQADDLVGLRIFHETALLQTLAEPVEAARARLDDLGADAGELLQPLAAQV